LDIYSKCLKKWSKSAGLSTGRSAGLSAYNRTLPYQTVSRCQIFTSFKSSNDSVCGHRGEFGGKQNSKNEAILGLMESSTQITHADPYRLFSELVRGYKITPELKRNSRNSFFRFLTV
jgi:hypothetical protein